jgi:photosystem II stability/assembly factor-like uncharacterized protein
VPARVRASFCDLDRSAPGSSAITTPFSIDPLYEATVENFYTTQFPSRWTNQVSRTAWRTSHDASVNWIRDEWSRLLQPFAAEGAFAEIRPFNFLDPNGGADNQDPTSTVGPESNVMAFMPGSDPVLRKEIVIVGGHYDCVDIVVDGGLDCGMQVPVATAVLEGLVRYWKANNLRPKRSLALFAIDGEEQCLCGSVHYTTLGSVNALFEHLELPPQLSVVAYHDTDMIGANYPNRMFGLSSNDFMPLNVFSAPTVENPQRVAGPFASYAAAIANPAFLARFRLYRAAILRQRDRFFADMRAKYPTWTYRDGVTKPLFTDAQKKYVNIVDDPLDRSDHTVFIANGIPADINIGFSDPSAAPPGWPSYHHPGETQEEVEYFRSGRMALNADTLLGYEATAAWVAYEAGAGEDSPVTEPFFLGETAPASLPAIPGLQIGLRTRDLPPMPANELPGTWRPLATGDVIVRALTIDPANSNRLYAATQSRGLLVSGNGGTTFAQSNTGFGAFTSLWNVAADPATTNRLYASTQHGAVFRSDDAGATWRSTTSAAGGTTGDVTFTAPMQPFVSSTDMLQNNIDVDQTHSEPGGTWLYGINQCLHQFAPAGQDCSTRADWPEQGFDLYDTLLENYRYSSDAAVMDNGTVVASGFNTYISDGGTFRSTDGGSTWAYTWRTASGGSPGNSNLWHVIRATPTRAYASGTGGVFRSDDSGLTWRSLGAPTSEVRALAVDPTRPDVVYAGSWDASGGVFKTSDGGTTWAKVSNGLPDLSGIAALAVDPSNPQRVAAATYWYGVYLSTDGGSTWKLAANGMPNLVRQRLDDVDFGPNGTLYAASHHGVFVFDNSPTGAAVTRFSATRTRAGVAISWQTGTEAETLGFNLFRNGAKVNPALIAAKHAGQTRGAAYRFVDRSARGRATYRLQLVQSGGTRTYRASATVR